MKGRSKTLATGATILVFFVGVAFIAVSQFGTEPKHKGRKLSYWLANGSELQLKEAVSAMGTNGIPTFIDKLRRSDSSWAGILQRLLDRQSLIDIGSYSPASQRLQGLAGFFAMGSNAFSAIPQLSNLIQNGSSPREACFSLAAIGEQSIPTLVWGASNSSPVIRVEAVRALGRMGNSATSAISSLVERTGDSDPVVRMTAAESLGAICELPEKSIPALVASLGDLQSTVRWKAATALGKFGVSARSALPDLEKLLKDQSPMVREEAATSIKRIKE